MGKKNKDFWKIFKYFLAIALPRVFFSKKNYEFLPLMLRKSVRFPQHRICKTFLLPNC